MRSGKASAFLKRNAGLRLTSDTNSVCDGHGCPNAPGDRMSGAASEEGDECRGGGAVVGV